MQKLEYTVLEMIESASRYAKTAPLNLGGVAGSGGGLGGPPGGFIGWLPQTRVAYDIEELSSSGTPASGMSILDNLNHIRYRISTLESGGSIVVFDDNTAQEYLDVTQIHFSGAGISIVDLGSGVIRAVINATGSGGGIEEAPIDGDVYGRKDASWIVINDFNLTVLEQDGSPSVSNVNTITISGGTVTDLGTGNVLIAFSGGTSGISDAPADGNTYGRNNNTWVIFSGGTGNVEEAPLDGNTYGRNNGNWVAISGINEAPIDGNQYVRQNASWVIFSGSSTESALHVYSEDHSSQSGSIYTTSKVYMSGTLRLYYNGVRQAPNRHYVELSGYTTYSAFFPTYSGDIMLVDYDYLLSSQTQPGEDPNALADDSSNSLTDDLSNILIGD